MGVTLFSEVLGAQLDQCGVIHSGASCPGATSHAETGASSRAGARILLFLLKHVAQGALAGSHRVLQQRTEETVGGSGTVTWDELGQEEKVKKEEQGRRKRKEREGRRKMGFIPLP